MLAQKLGLSLPSLKKVGGGAAFENLYSLHFNPPGGGKIRDFVDLGDQQDFTPNQSGENNGFSIGFWFKTSDDSTPTQIKRFLGKSDIGAREYDINIKPGGAINMSLYSNGNASLSDGVATCLTSTTLNDGNWHQIIYTWDLSANFSTGFKVYVDGSQDTSALTNLNNSWVGVINTSTALTFGKIMQANTNISTLMDEVFIVDDELSASQVTSIYNGGVPIDMNTIDKLFGWWRMGDTAGPSVFPTIADFSTKGNNGTMTFMTSSEIVTDVP